MNILVFGGTTEGRLLVTKLTEEGHTVTVSVATELGAEELQGLPCQILIGRKTREELCDLVTQYDKVIDATHPYAEVITENLQYACQASSIPLERIERETASLQANCVRVPSVQAAAEYLQGKEGNVLVTTGSKELHQFSILKPEQVFARVLPTHEALDICEELQLPHRNILAMQGPFTKELNEACIHQYHIRYLVTKDGGIPGGFSEKLESARTTGVTLILVERPEEKGTRKKQVK